MTQEPQHEQTDEHHEGTESSRFRKVMTVWMIVFSLIVIYGLVKVTDVVHNNKTAIRELAESKASNESLKNQLNKLGVDSCISSIPTYSKFNDLVRAIISARTAQLKNAEEVGDQSLIAVHKAAIKRYQHSFITLPTVQQCKHRVIIKPVKGAPSGRRN